MPSSPKTGIFFDAGDTLFEVRGGVGFQYGRIAKQHGIFVSAETLDQRFKTVFLSNPPLTVSAVNDRLIREQEKGWWRAIVQSVFEGYSLPEALFNEIYDFFEGPEAWRLFPEVLSVLERLKRKGYYLGIISNFDSRLEAICRNLGIRDFFQSVTISSREGFSKPSPEIFSRALRKAALQPMETIHVGDSFDHDVKGAMSIGMTPILLDRGGRYHGRTDTISIPNLSLLFDYL